MQKNKASKIIKKKVDSKKGFIEFIMVFVIIGLVIFFLLIGLMFTKPFSVP